MITYTGKIGNLQKVRLDSLLDCYVLKCTGVKTRELYLVVPISDEEGVMIFIKETE